MMLIPTRIVCVAVNLTAKPFSIEFYKQMGFFLVCLKFSGDLNLFSDQKVLSECSEWYRQNLSV